MIADAEAEVDRLTEQVLALPPVLRELVAYRIWESLHPGEDWELAPDQIEEIRRRVADLDAGTVELVDGDEAIARIRRDLGL